MKKTRGNYSADIMQNLHHQDVVCLSRMTCAACVASVESAVKKVGVLKGCNKDQKASITR